MLQSQLVVTTQSENLLPSCVTLGESFIQSALLQTWDLPSQLSDCGVNGEKEAVVDGD